MQPLLQHFNLDSASNMHMKKQSYIDKNIQFHNSKVMKLEGLSFLWLWPWSFNALSSFSVSNGHPLKEPVSDHSSILYTANSIRKTFTSNSDFSCPTYMVLLQCFSLEHSQALNNSKTAYGSLWTPSTLQGLQKTYTRLKEDSKEEIYRSIKRGREIHKTSSWTSSMQLLHRHM